MIKGYFLKEKRAIEIKRAGTVFQGKLLSFIVSLFQSPPRLILIASTWVTLRVKWPSRTTHSSRPLTISIDMPTTMLLTLLETFSDKNILQHIIRHKPPAPLNPISPFCSEWYHVIICLTSSLWRLHLCLVPSHKTPIHHD